MSHNMFNVQRCTGLHEYECLIYLFFCVSLLWSNSQTLLFLCRFWYVFFVVIIFQHFCFELSSQWLHFIHLVCRPFDCRFFDFFFFEWISFDLTQTAKRILIITMLIFFSLGDNFYQFTFHAVHVGDWRTNTHLKNIFENSFKSDN